MAKVLLAEDLKTALIASRDENVGIPIKDVAEIIQGNWKKEDVDTLIIELNLLIDANSDLIKCPNCKKVLGSFNGKVAETHDGLVVKEGRVGFNCSQCGVDVDVCANSLDIQLKTNKTI